MSDLPIPLSRIDLYLAVAAGMTGVTMPEKPLSRLEQFLAYIAGDTSVTLPTPLSLTELWLAYVAGVQPKTDEMKLEGAYYIGGQKVDVRYFAVAGGMEGVTAPAPQNRTEEYWARIAEIRPIHGVLKYATGTSIALTDVVSGIEELQYVYGDTSQQTYSGKNLLKNNLESTSKNGVTVTVNADGSVTLTGTSTSSSVMWFILHNNTFVLPAGTYTFSGAASSSVALYNASFGLVSSSTTRTLENGSTGDWSIRVDGNAATNVTIYPMVEAGGQATSYEPYVGGIPAPNPDYPQDVNVVTGTQNVWVHGKNLFSGWTVDKIVDPSTGVETSNADAADSDYIPVDFNANSQYYLSGLSAGLYGFVAAYNASNQFLGRTGASGGLTYRALTSSSFTAGTPQGTGDIAYLRMAAYKSGQYQDPISSVTSLQTQLEDGSTATAYEPYQSQSYNVDLTGKNLFNTYGDVSYGVGTTIGTVTNNMDGTITTTANGGQNFGKGQLITGLVPGQTYTLSAEAASTTATISTKGYISVFPEGKRTDRFAQLVFGTSGNYQSATFTLASGYTGVWVSFMTSQADASTTFSNIQLEEGSATTYAPYYNYDLCKIGDYQDYIYKSGDDWYVHKETGKVVLNGDENVVVNYTGTTNWFYTITNGYGNAASNNTISSHYIYNGSITASNTIQGASITSGGAIRVRFGTEDTAVNYKTWLTNNNVTLYYVLATSTYTKITDVTLISQLNAIDSAVLPKPIAYINVGATGTNLPGALKISYYGEEE